MKKILLTGIALILGINAWGVPAYPGWQTKILAGYYGEDKSGAESSYGEYQSGEEILLRQMGDEVYSYWVTKDGRIAEEQKDGRFVVTDQTTPSTEEIRARRNAHVQMRHGQNGRNNTNGAKGNGANGRMYMPMGPGNPIQPERVLVLLVEYQDVRFQAENGKYDFWKSFNQPGYDHNGATGSVADYFDAQSNGQYLPVFDVYGPFTLPHDVAYYGEEGTKDDVVYHDMYTADLVTDAVDAAEAAGCDFSLYDANNDGYVDIVYLLFAGKGQAAGGSSATIWPHNGRLYSQLDYGFTHGTSGYYANKWYMGIDNLPTFDGKTINNYVCSAELQGNGDRSGIGTPCHEFGHVLGLPDYYDTQYGENSKNGITPKEWSAMDQGSYNNNGNTPPNYSIFDKYYLGWATPRFLGKNEQANGRMGIGYGNGYQISGGNSLVAYSDPGTVYYIENRQKEGWDSYLPGHGMIVWKVQFDQTTWEYNEVNNTAGAPRCTIVPADGKTSGYGTYSDAFPGTRNPVTEFTPFAGCAITDIYEAGGRVGFKYNGGTEQYLFGYEASGIHCSAPEANITSLDYNLNMTFVPETGYSLADASCWEVYMGKEKLVYGTGFTYDEESHLMNIPAVKDHIVIIAHAWKELTWIAEDTVCAQTLAINDLINAPYLVKACEGRAFIGWTPEEHYKSETQAPELVESYSKVGDTCVFYAVYGTKKGDYAEWASVQFATAEADGSDVSEKIGSIVESATNIASYSGTKVFAGKNGAKLGSSKANGNMTITLEKTVRTSKIQIKAGKYGNDASSISLSVNGGTAFGTTETLSEEMDYITFRTEEPMEIESITIQATKRAYIGSMMLFNETLYGDYDYRCSIEPVTIRFFDGDEEISSQQLQEGDIAEVPEAPEGCDQYTFAGWWTSPLAQTNTTAHEWVSDFTVTQAQDYFAVYSLPTTGEEPEPQETEYVFSDAKWTEPSGTWQSVKNGGQYVKDNQGVQVTTGSSGAGTVTKTEMSDVRRVVANYCTNASKGAGEIVFRVGESEQTLTVTKTGGTSLRDLSCDFDHASGKVSIVVNCTTNSIYIHSVSIVCGVEAEQITYYTTMPECEQLGTSVEKVQRDDVRGTKFIKDGVLFIMYKGTMYNVQGEKVRWTMDDGQITKQPI
ncbi:MAG: M6 family metalloprotease domain-containing protein [Paludibacteraceae bacterium]|nr:M6 family metalloprotease domain-containing protein [Paludibacteraceae bacterium]